MDRLENLLSRIRDPRAFADLLLGMPREAAGAARQLGAVLPARGTVELGFAVTPPAGLEPGQWWALVRVGCAGRLVYSPAVRVTVT